MTLVAEPVVFEPVPDVKPALEPEAEVDTKGLVIINWSG